MLKSAAIVTIHGAGKMTKKGRKSIAAWLRKHAEMLEKEGEHYSEGRFTGRYLYDDKRGKNG